MKMTIPTLEIEDLQKLVKKVSKFLPGFSISFGKEYLKVYNHAERDIDGNIGTVKQWHNVVDIEITMPEINSWQLLATVDDGLLFVNDPSKEVVFSNSEHGVKYCKCDICGHWCKKSYIIRNSQTNEELQVGFECAKKFGIGLIKHITLIHMQLTKLYDHYCSFAENEDFPSWSGKKDAYAFSTIAKTDLIRAAKAYYNECPVWKKGYYVGKTYVKSKSNADIQQNVLDKVFDGDDDYVKAVCEYILTLDANSEFACDMNDLAKSFYAQPSNASHAFFMVKAYEEEQQRKLSNRIKLEVGMQVKVDGEVIASNVVNSFYGSFTKYSIKTQKGYIVERSGVIPITEDNGIKHTSFFAIVKNIHSDVVSLDRALKHAKKGVEIIEL